MVELEKKGDVSTTENEEEEKSSLMDGVTVLDFDMLCSTVALQANKGKWGKLNEDDEDESLITGSINGGGVLRMWEGEIIYNFFDDQRLALQSSCCPCYRFGKNMKQAGFGSCLLQGSLHLLLSITSLSSLLAFILTGKHFFVYLAIAFAVLTATYTGFFRIMIRKKFNIRGSDSHFDDCIYHLICHCCTLSQESRTMEMNVEDGIWYGRRDTIFIGTVLTKSPECLPMQKNSNDNVRLSTTSMESNLSLSVSPLER